jgi:hypothetical protein
MLVAQSADLVDMLGAFCPEDTMLGIVEVITLLLGLSGFGLHPNPRAPTADAALAYALPDADIVVHVDAQALIPGNYKLLTDLPNNPQIKASPELAKAVREIVLNAEGARGIAKTTTGIDITTDVFDATLFIRIVPGHDPDAVGAVHGKFSPQVIDKLGKMTGGNVSKIGGGTVAEIDARNAVALTKDGVLLGGSKQLVKDRLADGWKAPPHGQGTTLAYAADVIAQKPVFAVAFTMSQTARKEASDALGKNFMSDLIQRHKAATFAVFGDGLGWTWVDTSKAGLDSMSQISDGVVDLLRAAQIAPRGFAKIALGAIDSYKGTNKQVDDLIAHKADLMKLVTTFTGDGQFKVSKNADATKLRLDVRASGKSASEVVPAGVVVPFALVGLFVARRADPSPPTMAPPAPPAKPSLTPPPTQKIPAKKAPF